jgi:acyl-CoA reductase-like NAD-dependent aldehyde dehydrogenase
LSVLSLSLTATDFSQLKAQFLKISREQSAQSDSRGARHGAQEYGVVMAVRPWATPFMQALKPRNFAGENSSKK